MKLLFVDEIKRDDKDKNFFAVGGLLMDSALYSSLVREVRKAFTDLDWGNSEFKGRYIFSKSVNESVPIDRRIAFVSRVAELSLSKKNSKYKLFFSGNKKGSTPANYLKQLSDVVRSLPKASSMRGDKSLVAVFIDETTLIEKKTIEATVAESLRGPMKILETINFVKTGPETFGMIALDALLYLWSWTQVTEIENGQLELAFGGQRTHDQKKLIASEKILSLVKSVKNIGE